MLKLQGILCFCIVVGLTIFGPGLGPQSIVAAEKTAPMPEQDVQVLASGPIHEAFAQAVALDPEPGITAPKAPPPLIEEIPPDQKPEGDVQWIPGYWAWDDERNEYIWVSGIWRVPPPDRQWVPGYWNPVTEGYQWIPGYWASVTAKETEYLPEPPESVDLGPSSNAPSPDYIWIPGCWLWHYGRYAWRPGYWAAVHPDWVWVPAYYSWTPRGYIFVSGYWDYTVIHRGVLFAPVFFPRVHLGLSFWFSPGFVIDLNIFNDALFVRHRYHHYYYGDYYAPRYYKRGIYPWFSLHARRVVYDPIYAHQRWHHRNDKDWENRLEARFRDRRQHEGTPPPRSFDPRTGPDKTGRSLQPAWPDSVIPLDPDRKTKAIASRFRPLSERERREFTQREKEVRTYQKERQGRETQRLNMPVQKALEKPEPNKEKFSRSPIMDRSNKKAIREKAPPTQQKLPKPNPNVEPLMRQKDLPRSPDKSQKSGDREQRSEVRGVRPMDKVKKSGDRDEQLEDHMQKSNNKQQRGDSKRQRWNER
jgi:hypothetical protein